MKHKTSVSIPVSITASVTAALLILVNGPAARAEDDLLNILNGGSAAGLPTTSAEASVQASALRPLVAGEGSEAQIFLSHFEKGDFERAFFHWPVAFGGKAFAAGATGRALYGFLLFKNGLAVSGLETLFSVEKPKEIDSAVVTLWKKTANDQHPAWSLVNVKWKPEWTEIFGIAAEVRVISRGAYEPTQVEELKELIKKTNVGTRERALLQWQMVLALSLNEKAAEAAQILANLMKAPNNPISQDLMTITAARLLFQNGYMDAAAAYYGKVPKASDYWIDAQEEAAWAEMRKAQPQNVLALTKTIVHPVFSGQVGPEPIFLRSLAQLKVCDYPGVVESLALFRERFRERTSMLLQIKNDAAQEPVARFISHARGGAVKLTDLGKDVRALPRHVTRDHILLDLIRTGQAMEEEGKAAGDLFLRSMNYEGLQPGSQAHIDAGQKQIQARVRSAQDAVYARLKTLADEEVAEISVQLQKMHIVETEVLQHISLAEKRIQASRTETPTERKGTTGSQNRDRVWFPAENETWFDEFANFKIDIKKGCQAKAGKGAL